MALYVVTAVRFDQNGEVEAVRWRSASGAANKFTGPEHEVPVDQVVEALDHGDVVEMHFAGVSGARLAPKVLQDGAKNVREEGQDPGRTLRDLPRF